ncbi:MAG: radical SAM family heme chaperone HemW [Nitrospira defluvii]|nr:radical SAM family heme chaperone HemW [Nitrospira defluvii]
MIQATGHGLYLHIPFCHQRCHFCAFYLEIHQARAADAFLSSLLTELRLYGKRHPFGQEPLDSIYFGGGTPTTLTPEQLSRVLSAAKDTFGLAHDAEVTVEAHPESVTSEGLSHLRDAGFTRISFGAESMDQDELHRVGRPGSVLNTVEVVGAARKVGFSNINLDLMYGLPGQTIESWAASLQHTIALTPTHLSCYALTIEEGTQLRTAIQRGTVPAPDDALQNEMEDLAEDMLNRAGYRRYEISNYSRPGFASRHNRLHWTGGQYLGLGPSAQSYVGGRRFGNVSNLAAYNQALMSGALPVSESEQLTPADDTCERLVFGLRMTDGISMEETGALAFSGLIRKMDELIAEEILERSGERIRLTARGRRYADSVAAALLASLENPPARVPSH